MMISMRYSWLKYVYLFAYLFCFIYSPRIITRNTIHILFVIAILGNFMYIGLFLRSLRRNQVTWFSIMAGLGAFIVLSSGVLYSNNLQVYRFWLLCIEVPFCVLYIVGYCVRRKIEFSSLLNILIYIGVLQASISVLMFLSPEFKAIINNHYFKFWGDKYIGWSQNRMYGLSDNLLHTTPIYQAVMALFCILIKEKKISTCVFVPMLLFSAFINSRTSAVCFVIGLFVCLLPRKKIISFSSLRNFAIIIVILIAAVVLVQSSSSDGVKYFLKGMETIKDFLITGISQGSFFDVFFNQFMVFPTTILGLLFGYGLEVQGNGIINSDIGFVNDIWSGGILFTAIIVGAYFMLIRKINKAQVSNSNKISIVLFIAFFIGYLKGIMTCMNDITNLILLLAGTAPVLNCSTYKKNCNSNVSCN